MVMVVDEHEEGFSQNRSLIIILVILFVIIIGLIIGIVLVRKPMPFFNGDSVSSVENCDDKKNNYNEEACTENISKKSYDLYLENYDENDSEDNNETAFLAGLDYLNKQYNNAEARSLKNDIAAARVNYCASYGKYEIAFDYSSFVDEELLSQEDKYYYFTNMSDVYYGLGNEERGLKYKELAIDNMTEEIMKNGRG